MMDVIVLATFCIYVPFFLKAIFGTAVVSVFIYSLASALNVLKAV